MTTLEEIVSLVRQGATELLGKQVADYTKDKRSLAFDNIMRHLEKHDQMVLYPDIVMAYMKHLDGAKLPTIPMETGDIKSLVEMIANKEDPIKIISTIDLFGYGVVASGLWDYLIKFHDKNMILYHKMVFDLCGTC